MVFALDYEPYTHNERYKNENSGITQWGGG